MNCLECDGSIGIPNDSAVGELVICPDCGADFEISDGQKLKPAEKVGEDWGE